MKKLEQLKNEKGNKLCIVKFTEGYYFSRLKYAEEKNIMAIFGNVSECVITSLVIYTPSFTRLDEAIQNVLFNPQHTLLLCNSDFNN